MPAVTELRSVDELQEILNSQKLVVSLNKMLSDLTTVTIAVLIPNVESD
jgi:hypothetical protein